MASLDTIRLFNNKSTLKNIAIFSLVCLSEDFSISLTSPFSRESMSKPRRVKSCITILRCRRRSSENVTCFCVSLLRNFMQHLDHLLSFALYLIAERERVAFRPICQHFLQSEDVLGTSRFCSNILFAFVHQFQLTNNHEDYVISRS